MKPMNAWTEFLTLLALIVGMAGWGLLTLVAGG